MEKNIPPKFNALKTGAHVREGLLPWESAAEYSKLRDEIFVDLQPHGKIQRIIVEKIVENLWQGERLRRTTAIATHSVGWSKIPASLPGRMR